MAEITAIYLNCCIDNQAHDLKITIQPTSLIFKLLTTGATHCATNFEEKNSKNCYIIDITIFSLENNP